MLYLKKYNSKLDKFLDKIEDTMYKISKKIL